MTLADIENALEQGLLFAAKAAPLASIGGPTAGAIGAVVGQIATTASTVLTQIENDATIIGSGDLTKIRALQAQLQAQNEALSAQIAAS